MWPVVRRTMSTAANMSQAQFSIAYITAPDKATGLLLARKLVEAKLAACVNIVPQVTSVYEWEGKLEEDSESLLIVKTRSSHTSQISALLKEHHPYDVPELILTPITDGSEQYLDWLGTQMPPRHTDK